MTAGYEQFASTWGDRAQLAWDTLALKPTVGIPTWLVHVMDVPFMEEMTGHPPGAYARDPDEVYLAFQRLAGACFIDQYIPENPLTMGQDGFEPSAPRKPGAGAERIILDGMEVACAEDVIEHMERFVFPRRAQEIAAFDPDDPARIERMVASECAIQRRFGSNLLKGPYADGFQSFPHFHYGTYGYADYFTAYALCPEVMEKDFAQQAELAVLRNRAAARAITEGGLPSQLRLDHDMAGSRGTLVGIGSLEAIWFPHFARAIQPFLEAGVRLIWHCDGNLMDMVPPLIEAGISGFQGFQYESGMDYERICRMTDRNGGPLLIKAGVSVTRTLPFGSRDDVARELKWLVDNGPRQGLFLGASSSITPRTPRENIRALIDGMHHYRVHGRA